MTKNGMRREKIGISPLEVSDGRLSLTPDFTKQYNRMRQMQSAAGSTSMLPARNQSRAAPVAGVALNPKMASDGHEKDKSDRATLEQVLDSRTRLVLTGLVNRDIIGKINRCISTGKEVRA